jgi:hypothetical protein
MLTLRTLSETVGSLVETHSQAAVGTVPSRRGLLMADIEQGLVRPHILVTGGDQETGTWRERQVSPDLGKPFHKMARVQWHEEVGCAGQLAGPYVPARRISLRRVPQAMHWPTPARHEQ